MNASCHTIDQETNPNETPQPVCELSSKAYPNERRVADCPSAAESRCTGRPWSQVILPPPSPRRELPHFKGRGPRTDDPGAADKLVPPAMVAVCVCIDDYIGRGGKRRCPTHLIEHRTRERKVVQRINQQ